MTTKPLNQSLSIEDVYGEAQSLIARIETSPFGIAIYVDGYGNDSMKPGHGSIVHMENCSGNFKLLAFADRENEEPTHEIEFEDARDEKLTPIEEPEFKIQKMETFPYPKEQWVVDAPRYLMWSKSTGWVKARCTLMDSNDQDYRFSYERDALEIYPSHWMELPPDPEKGAS